jgi:hypothetical protein
MDSPFMTARVEGLAEKRLERALWMTGRAITGGSENWYKTRGLGKACRTLSPVRRHLTDEFEFCGRGKAVGVK